MGAGRGGLSQVTLAFGRDQGGALSWKPSEMAQVGGTGGGEGQARGLQMLWEHAFPSLGLLKGCQAGLPCATPGAPFTLELCNAGSCGFSALPPEGKR